MLLVKVTALFRNTGHQPGAQCGTVATSVSLQVATGWPAAPSAVAVTEGRNALAGTACFARDGPAHNSLQVAKPVPS